MCSRRGAVETARIRSASTASVKLDRSRGRGGMSRPAAILAPRGARSASHIAFDAYGAQLV